ncbi:prominin-2-like [Scyliorhinus canicula]|uniref:prominin-2-like n=1 Tax=Scyliorhinus canicula TaxID=7830 RepID=UPI0018F32469|nr:prominin-2-like [Scyliorhinus canicula]
MLSRDPGKMARFGMPACLLLAAAFLGPTRAVSPNCTADELAFQTVLQSNFQRLDGDGGSLEPLYDMVNRYLDAVQPNPFPTDIIVGLLKDRSVEPLKVVKYEAGYLVSLIIGVLFFVFVPLVGLFFCCCRCCNNCGGQVKERTGSTDCQRNTLATFLLMTTLIILAGVACAFTVNQKVTDAMDSSVTAIQETIGDVTAYAEGIVKAIPKIANQFSVPKNQTLTDLDDLNKTLGFTIQDALAPTITPVLTMVMQRIQDFGKVKSDLVTVRSTQASLLETQRQLAVNLTKLQGEINATLKDGACIGCQPVQSAANNLQLNVNYTEPPEFQALFITFDAVSQMNLTNSLQKGNRTFNEIPARVAGETSQIISDANVQLQEIERDVLRSTQSLTFADQLKNVTNDLNSTQLENVTDSVKEYDYYRWIVGIVLCCIILLIIACNILGLGFGTAGIATRNEPYAANGCSLSGANFLMAGVGFSFIFSWLLILLVFVTFFVGGNVRTLVCKPWESGEIYEAIDSIAAANSNLNLSKLLGFQLNISELHRGCERGESLFQFLPERQVTQLNNALNLSTYTADLEKTVDRLEVDLSSVVLLDSAGNSSLQSIANSGVDRINYTDLIQQVQQPILKAPLLGLADSLEALKSTQTSSDITERLTRHISDLRELESTSVNKMKQELDTLKASFQNLEALTPRIKGDIQMTTQSIETAQNLIEPTTNAVLKNVSKCLLNKQQGYFGQYIAWARETIIDQLLSCQPILILLDNSRVISCDYIIDPWNAFWFCLGWCTLFLIPSIIFAVKTAKHYRPVKNKSNSPEFSEMSNFKFPRAQNAYDPSNLYEAPAF